MTVGNPPDSAGALANRARQVRADSGMSIGFDVGRPPESPGATARIRWVWDSEQVMVPPKHGVGGGWLTGGLVTGGLVVVVVVGRVVVVVDGRVVVVVGRVVVVEVGWVVVVVGCTHRVGPVPVQLAVWPPPEVVPVKAPWVMVAT